MTREEIEELKGLSASMGLYDDKKPCKRAVILGKAIKALEQEPCGYAVSRQAAINAAIDGADKWDGGFNSEREKCIREEIEKLPPVTPLPKMGSSSENPNKCGEWRHYEGMLYCSQCGTEFYDEIMEYTGDEAPKYCPQCGQPKMQEVEE